MAEPSWAWHIWHGQCHQSRLGHWASITRRTMATQESGGEPHHQTVPPVCLRVDPQPDLCLFGKCGYSQWLKVGKLRSTTISGGTQLFGQTCIRDSDRWFQMSQMQTKHIYICMCIYIIDFEGGKSNFLRAIPANWHSIWHVFWHSIWHVFWHSLWHSIWHLAFYLTYIL